MKYILLLLFFFITVFQACSDLEDNISEPQEVNFHPEGIVDPASPDFHGRLVKNNSWNLDLCRSCHGADFHGGTVDASCTNCHDQFAGPENCSTCHGSETSPAPPSDLDGNIISTYRGVGAHQAHVIKTSISKLVSCTECHAVPAAVKSPGHLDNSPHAEVIMDNFLANLVTNDPAKADIMIYDPTLPVFNPDPSYDPESLSCSGTYCHGAFKNGNLENAAVWSDSLSAECGSCHGNTSRPTLRERALPRTVEEGGTHPGGLQCHSCHGGVVDENLKFINTSKHIDGKLNFLGNDLIF